MQVGQAKNFKLENIEVAQVKDLIHMIHDALSFKLSKSHLFLA